MDETDKALLAELGQDARASVAVLARRLGLARTTVQARIERLENRGIIAGYGVRLGPAARQGRIRATVLLQIEPRSTAQVLSRLKAVTEVQSAHTTSGRFDLLLELACPDTAALDTLLDLIGATPGVQRSESLIHLSTKIDRTL